MNDNCADQHIPINYTTKIHTKIENTDALSVLNVNEQNLKGNSVVDAWQKWTIKKEIEIKKKQIEEQTYFFENKIKSARETIEKINKVNLNQKKVHEWIHKKAEIDNMVLRKKIKDKIQSNQETKEIEKKRELETKKCYETWLRKKNMERKQIELNLQEQKIKLELENQSKREQNKLSFVTWCKNISQRSSKKTDHEDKSDVYINQNSWQPVICKHIYDKNPKPRKLYSNKSQKSIFNTIKPTRCTTLRKEFLKQSINWKNCSSKPMRLNNQISQDYDTQHVITSYKTLKIKKKMF